MQREVAPVSGSRQHRFRHDGKSTAYTGEAAVFRKTAKLHRAFTSSIDRSHGYDYTPWTLEVIDSASGNSTRIEGAISFQGARMDNSGGRAFNAYRLGVGGGVFWTGGHATGEFNLPSSQITGQVQLSGSTVVNPEGDAVCLNGTVVEGNVLCGQGFSARGKVTLWQSRVTGQVDFDGARLANPGGEALCCRQLHADELRLTAAAPIDGTVNLSYARISVIRDDPETWPAELQLDGVVYDVVHPLLSADRRLAWLGSRRGEYLPHPYQQLATAYQKLGHDADARTVLVAKQRHRRASLPVVAKAWGYLQDVTVGYGYRPLRAGLWLLALLALGTTVFWLAPPVAVDPGRAPAFTPLIYTVDLRYFLSPPVSATATRRST